MRPGTVDYSKWDAIHTSSSDDEAVPSPQRVVAPLAAAPTPPPAESAPSAPLASPDSDEADRVSRLLPVLVGNMAAMRSLGSDNAKAGDPILAQLPDELASALRALTAANDAARGAARIAALSRAGRAAASSLTPQRALAAKRDHVFRALVANLTYAAEADTRAPPQRDPDEYVSSDEEGEALAYAVLRAGSEDALRVLRELARWTEVPTGVAAQLPVLLNVSRMVLNREFEPAAEMLQASMNLRRARSEGNRAWHNTYVAEHGGAPAPPLPPPPEPRRPTAGEQLAYDGELVCMLCMGLSCAEAVKDSMRALNLGGAA